MKTAIINGITIHLDKCEREKLPWMLREAKKGNAYCLTCHRPVRLHIGIVKPPYFYHIQQPETSCKPLDETITANAASDEYIERNGFRIPQARSIHTGISAPQTTFIPPMEVTTSDPFSMKSKQKFATASPYLKLMASTGISLDEQQTAAVCHEAGPLLVLAGAGSGKTRVLTSRTAFLLHEQKADPGELMLVTFTAKAAAEMKSRLLHYPDMHQHIVRKLVAGTFHSIFYKIVSFHQPQIWSFEKLLSKNWQREQLLKEAGLQLNLDDKEFSYDLALQQISLWKNTMITPAFVRPENDWEEKVKGLFEYYERKKKENNAFDFDDMLLGCFELFQKQPEILEIYQMRFKHILIDEFQDINKIQYELIKLLSARYKNIFAVGDDDQSIYAFRGSDPNHLLSFQKEFSNASVIALENNYRSSHEIVSAANTVIMQNKKRHQKTMAAQYELGTKPLLFYPYDEEEEATMVLTDILDKLSNGFQPDEIAIIFRTHAASRAMFEQLAYSSIPFVIDQDAESFYERFIVKSMVGFLQLSIDEDQQEAIKAILPSLFVKQSILRDLKAEGILQDKTLLECLSTIKTGYAFQERKLKKVPAIVRSVKGLTPLKAIEWIEKELGFQDFIKKRGNEGNSLERGSDDLKDLKIAAQSYTSIADFLEHIDHMKAMNKEIKKQKQLSGNVVTLSTIHRAKGLEYKAVYILGAADGSLPHDYALEAGRNGDYAPLEEERRLLYVAMTRAKEHLYISVPEKRRGKKTAPCRFLKPLLPRQKMKT